MNVRDNIKNIQEALKVHQQTCSDFAAQEGQYSEEQAERLEQLTYWYLSVLVHLESHLKESFS